MNTTRRQFVAVSAATLPALLCASDVDVVAAGPPAADDQVLAQIESAVVRAYTELRDNPGRVEPLRSFETSLRFHAAYAKSTQLDASLRKTLRKSVTSRGRAEWINDFTGDQHRSHRGLAEIKKRHPGIAIEPRLTEFSPLSSEEAGRVLDQLMTEGVAPALERAAAAVQTFRERVSGASRGQFHLAARKKGFCDSIQEILRGLEIIMGIVCGLSMFDPALIPECAVITAEWVITDALQWLCELY
jgi:hypothetical protein